MSKRSNMLASVIREIIAPELRACPSACGVVSITEIEVSEDYSYATVYLSALQEPQLALQHFQQRQAKLKTAMGSLRLWRIPELRFRLDLRAQRGMRLDALLSDAEESPDN